MKRSHPRRAAAALGQLDFGFRTPKRPRKPRRGRPRSATSGVSHLRRQVPPRCPLHVTLRMRRHVYQLRSRRCYSVLERSLYKGAASFGARVVQFSVQRDHVHLVVEAAGARALARGMQGLAIRMAKGLNKVMGRRGAVFADRYHSRPLRTPTEVRAALVYVLNNFRKHHDGELSRGFIDGYSSGRWFDGWASPPPRPPEPPPVVDAETWLLTTGWRERGGGPLERHERPRSG